MATGQRMPKKIDDEREFFPSRRAELCPSTAVFRFIPRKIDQKQIGVAERRLRHFNPVQASLRDFVQISAKRFRKT
jgi:hypothetical protein